MRTYLLTTYLLLISVFSIAQTSVSPPYFTDFENTSSIAGWSHYAISGTDDWEWGTPTGYYLYQTKSGTKAWGTNIEGNYNKNSNRVLQSPFFDLSDTSKEYIFSFHHQAHLDGFGSKLFLEYRIGTNGAWAVLVDSTMRSHRWQSLAGGFYDYFHFRVSSLDLEFLEGNSNVQFRFRFLSNSADADGWVIDDVTIDSTYTNIKALPGDTIYTTMQCRNLTFVSNYFLNKQFTNPSPYLDHTYYYLSTDSVLDNTDSLIATKVHQPSINSQITVSKNFTLPYLYVNKYYIIYKYDAIDTLPEANENDNVSFSVLVVDSIYPLPYFDSFEDSTKAEFRFKKNFRNSTRVWEKGMGRKHQIENAHSGVNAWHTSDFDKYAKGACGNNCPFQYVESPNFDFTSTSGNEALNFWHKGRLFSSSILEIEYSTDCGNLWHTLTTFPASRDDDWDFANIPLRYPLDNLQNFSQVKFRVSLRLQGSGEDKVIFDDFYVGPEKADLSIERDLNSRFSPSNRTTDTIKYFLNNSGGVNASSSTTKFYWSNDSIFDNNDVLIGSKAEISLNAEDRSWTTFVYNKQSTTVSTYYIFYELDAQGQLDEMREYNNIDYFKFEQQNTTSLPYTNDFETQINGWTHNSSLNADEWQWTDPKGTKITHAFSGTKAWITNDTGQVTSHSRMHLYTPIFDLSNAVKPVIAFNMNLEQYHSHTNMSYSVDGGATWQVLDATSNSYNRWYWGMFFQSGHDFDEQNKTRSTLMMDAVEYCFPNVYKYNSRDVKRNTRYINDISFLAGHSSVRFRFNLASPDNSHYLFNGEGALIDDFEIKEKEIDLRVDYKKALMIGSNAKFIKVELSTFNDGNFVTDSVQTDFYLSTDSVLGSNDLLIYTAVVDSIRPDFYANVNFAVSAPSQLSNYNYLLIETDASQSNVETDESNNLTYWDLAIDSVNTYPYINNFNDTVIDGWHQYATDKYRSQLVKIRMRTQLAPTELVPAVYYPRESGEWFTELQSHHVFFKPIFYLESPSFNLEHVIDAVLEFDLGMTGKNGIQDRDGGNLEYTIDGGNTWNVLTDVANTAINWYDQYPLANFNNESGWHDTDLVKTKRTINIKHLTGNGNIQFRFKYQSNHQSYYSPYRQGFKLDNFKLSASTVDLIANTSNDTLNTTLANAQILLSYNQSNKGNIANPVNSVTEFYWSDDTIIDTSDKLLKSLTEASLQSNSNRNRSTSITYPRPIDTTHYFILYKLDANDSQNEISENNNIGYYHVIFPNYPDLSILPDNDTIQVNNFQKAISIPYQMLNSGNENSDSSSIGFYWSSDSILSSSDLLLNSDSLLSINIRDTLSSLDSISIPTSSNNGYHYIIYKADYQDKILEHDETNNTSFKTVELNVFSDHTAGNFGDTLNAFLTSSTLSFYYKWYNWGERASLLNSKTEFYWSTDSLLDNSDVLLNSLLESSIGINDSVTSAHTISYPTPLDTINYFIIYKLDADDNEIEINETNNIGFFRVHFADYSNLTTTNYRDTLVVVNRLQTILIPYKVYNLGNNLADSSITASYWSTDTILDINDIGLSTDTIGAVLELDSISSSISFNIPTNTPNGIYYFIYALDSKDSITELNEQDNLAYKYINVDVITGFSSFEESGFKAFIYNKNLIIIKNNLKINDISVSLRNTLGQIMFEKETKLNEGRNQFSLPVNLSKGVYFVVLRSNSFVKTIEFVY